MTKIWVVEGATGEYSDHREWPVAFYKTQKEAQECVDFLSRMSRVAATLGEQEHKFMHQFDPQYTNYTSTYDNLDTVNYYCFDVPSGQKYSNKVWTDEKVQMLTHLYKEKKK